MPSPRIVERSVLDWAVGSFSRALILVACASSYVGAQPVATATTATSEHPSEVAPPVPTPAPLTAADVANAPGPGFESGRTDQPVGDSFLRTLGRGALFAPKLVIDTALSPIYLTAWAEDRYHLDELYYRAFYNADRTLGVYPTGTYSSGFGLNLGAGFIAKDLAGEHESIAAQATTGAFLADSYQESLATTISSGARFGWLELGIESSFDRRPDEPFSGIGNADLTTQPASGVDPRGTTTAISTRYRYQEARAAASASIRLTDAMHLRASEAITDHEFAGSRDELPTDVVYSPRGLVGWSGFANVYSELELRIDKRRRASQWEPAALHAEGWLVAAALGNSRDLGANLWRGTLELQQFWRIAQGPRLIALRFRTEAISGSLADVPFSELPALGGADFLRGYDYNRFRDRVAAVGSVEYVWDLAHWFAAALFVDVGRVYPSLADLSLDKMRVGYGVALEVFDDASFLCEASVASSIEGGLFLNVSFNPIYDARPRWR